MIKLNLTSDEFIAILVEISQLLLDNQIVRGRISIFPLSKKLQELYFKRDLIETNLSALKLSGKNDKDCILKRI